MPSFEYKTIKLATTGVFKRNFDEVKLDEYMNQLGAEGWELVSAFDINRHQGGSQDVVAIFKRQQ
ncbi:DUF4177 domain-containing protein [Acaryochloris sp. 'Moss Beach']|uniref:DUF4177 domain-containing protein n=1 Tax=Acaryochloris TaxID=155977 RepID=UPI001BAE9DE4|nr:MULTISPECIES: DUF4177 domain-containing protein [Acaryochloris]QUY41407.1 DUF4177 domain-containing protein [Acaryochloris marina S15]UJB70570.1 DUF4177 domain-containing protein [Acaryochloris sp. 'Moss Beach']